MRLWKRSKRNGGEVAARIEGELASLRPMLHLGDAGIQLVRFESATGLAILRFEGDCPDCEMSALTLRQAVEAHLRTRIPELREIRALGERGTE
jgi:Fe-S cluster biogenesis protein NfuA